MWLKIKVLLWKSLKLRKRHWMLTIIELIVPCLLFIFMKYIKDKFGNFIDGHSEIVDQVIPSPVSEKNLIDDFISYYSLGYFIYTPHTPETVQIMKYVSTNLNIASNNIDTAESEYEMIKKFKNKFNTSEEYSKYSNQGFGIVFEEIKQSQIFKYKIRSTDNVWNTDHLFPWVEIPGPMDVGDVYLKKGFIALQLMLDKAFINLNSTTKLDEYKLEVQSYPYAKYIKDSSFQQLFEFLFPLFTVFSFSLMCAVTIKRIVEEKDTGVKELMKMMGLKPWMIWTGWILHNWLLYAISIAFISYVCCFEIYSDAGRLLNHTNPVLLWIFLVVYMTTGIFFCFAVSSIFRSPLIALLVGIMLWSASYVVTYIFLKSPTINIFIKTICMLLPNYALSNGFTAISSLESLGVGLGFSTLFTIGKGNNSFSVGFILFMFIVDCFLYGFIAWYLDSVMPGKYGVAKPLLFLFDWSKKTSVIKPTKTNNNKLFEEPPSGFEIGISIKNLHKSFGNFNAVNGVNMDLYKGQITALLGHNGAGKTTTMSIISGLFSPTTGSVEVNGKDLFSNLDEFRENLGLCPQHNLLFSYLTTLDHLIFFGMLKGITMQQAKSEGYHLLELLNILQKKDELVSSLSGGMKRKLSLAIALVGNPKVLILDEPTSGMDPESRREMWDLLLSFRGSRTILITTHFMEEADVLGDRIAIMDHGVVKCYGTSIFLKKIYGTGFTLTIVLNESYENFKLTKKTIIDVIKDAVPEADIKKSMTAQLVVNLPNENIDQFPDLFRTLETFKSSNSIIGMGISCTTMEEVFLRAKKNIEDDNNSLSSINCSPMDNGCYQLLITKNIDCDVDQVTNLVKQYVPEGLLMINSGEQLLYNLPSQKISQFGPLYSALKFQKQLKLNSVEISNATVGIIYPNTFLDKEHENELKQQPVNDITETLMPNHTSGILLLKNQLIVLLRKKVTYTCRRWFMTLLFVIGCILLNVFVMKSTYELLKGSEKSESLSMSLSIYEDSSVLYRAGDNSSDNLEPNFVAISKRNHAIVKETSPESYIINDLLAMCNQDVFKYRTNLMIAGDFNGTNSTVIYNNIAIHTPAIAINLYTNALLQKIFGNSESYISTVNDPIILRQVNVCDSDFAMNLVMIWLTLFTPLLLFLLGYFMALPLAERVSGIKHLQMMTKLSPITYWAACFIWDYFCYVIVVITLLITIYLFDTYAIFSGPNELGALLIIMLIYGWSSIFYAYVYSFFKKTLVSSMLLFISINFIIGFFVNNTMYVLKPIFYIQNKEDPYNYWNIFRLISLIIPHFSYSSCLAGFLDITWENNRYKVCKSPDMLEALLGSVDSKQKSYFVFASDENKSGILEETLFLFFSSILYIAIILLFDYKVFARLYQFGFNIIVGTGVGFKGDIEDPDVTDERDKVDAAKSNNSNNSSLPILLVDDLVKKFSFKFTGVRGISFAVSPGECFGLLGVNGAGKTTTFRILTGDTFPSKGDASIQTDKLCKLSSDTNQYMSMIGYCPQFDAINDHLTGRETLHLMAVLRGISPQKTKKHVNKWIKLLGLEEYKDVLSGVYSGGNKRKLNTAMALIGDPPVVFLDEPTSGVDPVSRRNLWKLLASSQRGGQAVILTSHSMDECEALCNRLTIMVDGVMKCIGNIQYLKNRYGQGFTVQVKLSNIDPIDVKRLKADIERQFAPDIVLKDEHKGLLHYHLIDPNIRLSEIFDQMKVIKENFPAVEDYTVGDTTLEQVFIAFAKKQAVLNTNQ